MNRPYKKQLDQNGECVNEITRANPFLNHSPNRRLRRAQKSRHRGNHIGVSIIATDTSVIRRTFQYLQGKVISHYFIKYFSR